MGAIVWQKTNMETLVSKLKQDYPGFVFVVGTALCWSPEQKQVLYDPTAGTEGAWGLLHELGHARLSHNSYASDLDLLRKETAAWHEAILIAKNYGLTPDQEHIQDCLDTYRDWLYKRSTCPTCQSKGLQTNSQRYECPNCGGSWQVSPSRFCRAYRRRATTDDK